jgi:hypothetical protein
MITTPKFRRRCRTAVMRRNCSRRYGRITLDHLYHSQQFGSGLQWSTGRGMAISRGMAIIHRDSAARSRCHKRGSPVASEVVPIRRVLHRNHSQSEHADFIWPSAKSATGTKSRLSSHRVQVQQRPPSLPVMPDPHRGDQSDLTQLLLESSKQAAAPPRTLSGDRYRLSNLQENRQQHGRRIWVRVETG